MEKKETGVKRREGGEITRTNAEGGLSTSQRVNHRISFSVKKYSADLKHPASEIAIFFSLNHVSPQRCYFYFIFLQFLSVHLTSFYEALKEKCQYR